MKTLSLRFSIVTLVATLGLNLILGTGQVRAAIAEKNDPVFGLGSITEDTDQGLEFLDVPFTFGRTRDDLSDEFGPGGDFEGFRFATYSEVIGLIDNYGFSPSVSTTYPLVLFGDLGTDQLSGLVSLLGPTVVTATVAAVQGRADIDAASGCTLGQTVVNVIDSESPTSDDSVQAAACVGPSAVSGTATYLVRDAATAIAYECFGFEPPMTNFPVKVKNNRVFPLRIELVDEDGFQLTSEDLTAPPVVQVMFESSSDGTAVDVSDQALPAGHGSEGNEFEIASNGIWQFNLKSNNYTAAGEYIVTAISGDDSEYIIDPACVTSFQID